MPQAREATGEATVPPVHGHCDERFAAVRDAFEADVRERDEPGAAVTVLVDGQPVADLYGAERGGVRLALTALPHRKPAAGLAPGSPAGAGQPFS